MSSDEVADQLIAAITEVQERSGRPLESIDSATVPLADIMGFDSLNIVEVVAIVSSSLGCDLRFDILFHSENEQEHLTISEMSSKICEVISEKGK